MRLLCIQLLISAVRISLWFRCLWVTGHVQVDALPTFERCSQGARVQILVTISTPTTGIWERCSFLHRCQHLVLSIGLVFILAISEECGVPIVGP